jgi:hypothetical protein
MTKANFEPHVGDAFRLHVTPSESVECTLIEVTGLSGAVGGREPFSLIFRAPVTFRSTQSIYTLVHPTFGTLDLFLVPIGPDQAGMCYQAIFT